MVEGEPFIRIQDLCYKPLESQDFILKNLTMNISKGDLILLLGPSGSGKSTLSRCFNGIIPHLDQGEMLGSVIVDGKNTKDHKIHEFASTVGMIIQNPDDQILSLRVVDEI